MIRRELGRLFGGGVHLKRVVGQHHRAFALQFVSALSMAGFAAPVLYGPRQVPGPGSVYENHRHVRSVIGRNRSSIDRHVQHLPIPKIFVAATALYVGAVWYEKELINLAIPQAGGAALLVGLAAAWGIPLVFPAFETRIRMFRMNEKKVDGPAAVDDGAHSAAMHQTGLMQRSGFAGRPARAWIVDIDAESPCDHDWTDEQEISLLRALDDFSPSSSRDAGRLSVRLTLDARSAEVALGFAERSWEKVATDELGLADDSYEIVRVVAESDEQRFINELSELALLGVAELAARLGVSKPRARQLASRDNFPRPVSVLAATPVWHEVAVQRFIQDWRTAKHKDGVAVEA